MMRHGANASCLVILLGAGCMQPWPMPTTAATPLRPRIYHHNSREVVPATSNQAAAVKPSTSLRFYDGGPDFSPPMTATRSLSGSQRPAVAEPTYPQYYYVRPEHTATGYTAGSYGRIDNYTPGQHTSTGYIPGNYRGDGNYTRPLHTSTGYIPGHYRSVPQPNPSSTTGSSYRSSGR
jgi:hypothetical protein